jgi:ADP-ribose pyrophosphatase YjhB (NUDIX family)
MTNRCWKRCYESLKDEQLELFALNRFRELFFLFHSEKKRETCVCVCVFVRAWWKEMRMRSVVFEKSLFSVEFRDFCLLRSILELIIRSLVNIKRERKKFTSLTEIKNSSLHLRFKLQKIHSTRYYTRSDFRLFYLILIFCAVSAF